ncbi:MAG: beta-ketoacyl synthase N-terminal-like domain-containing protein [Thermoanaerobaculia bacterium]
MREILVTGAAAVTSLGRDLETTAARLAAGESALVEITAEEGGARKGAAFAARIGAFTTEPELPKAKARRLDRGSQFAVVAVTRCLADAAWATAGREEETGIVLGTGSAGAGPLVELERQMAVESPETASPFLFPYTVANAPAAFAAIELKIKGPNVTITQKDPAGLNALFYSRFLIDDERAKAIVAGAVDEWNLTYHLAYERLGVLKTPSKPGYVMTEGCSVVLLEDAASARARGARPWARLAGAASSGSPVSPQKRRARPGEVAATLRAALADAKVEPSRVGLVQASANGVPWVDAAEEAALAELFGPAPRVERPKLLVGENPCSGALQLALAARALREEPSLGAVVVNSLGAGGNQIAVVLTAP